MRKRLKHNRARGRGFTIVECLLAGLILAIFTAGIAAAVGQARQAAQQGEDLRLAANWLDEVFTRIDLIGPARLLMEGPTQGQLDDRFTWSAVIQEETIGDLYDVRVTIRWQTGGRTRAVTGYSQFQDPPGAQHVAVGWYDL